MTGHDTNETLAVVLYESEARRKFETSGVSAVSWWSLPIDTRIRFRQVAHQMTQENEHPDRPIQA